MRTVDIGRVVLSGFHWVPLVLMVLNQINSITSLINLALCWRLALRWVLWRWFSSLGLLFGHFSFIRALIVSWLRRLMFDVEVTLVVEVILLMDRIIVIAVLVGDLPTLFRGWFLNMYMSWCWVCFFTPGILLAGLLVYLFFFFSSSCFFLLLIMIYDEWDNEDLLEISHEARMRKRVAWKRVLGEMWGIVHSLF